MIAKVLQKYRKCCKVFARKWPKIAKKNDQKKPKIDQKWPLIAVKFAKLMERT